MSKLEQEPTTKNNLGVDWESYKDVDGNSLDDFHLGFMDVVGGQVCAEFLDVLAAGLHKWPVQTAVMRG